MFQPRHLSGDKGSSNDQYLEQSNVNKGETFKEIKPETQAMNHWSVFLEDDYSGGQSGSYHQPVGKKASVKPHQDDI